MADKFYVFAEKPVLGIGIKVCDKKKKRKNSIYVPIYIKFVKIDSYT